MQRRPSVAPRGLMGDEAMRLSAKGGPVAAAPQITEELLAMEAGDRPFTERMRACRSAIVAARGERYYTDLVATLVHRAHPPVRARALFEQIRAHKAELARSLGRDPGIRVAALDFAANVEPDAGDVPCVERAAFRGLAEAGRRDPDTGLLDRASLHAMLDRVLVDAAKRRSPISVVILRVEGEGFAASHLAALALAIRSGCRAGDAAARYAPDALALVLGDTDGQRARRFVERLGGIAQDVPGSCRLRFGLAVHPDDARTARALLRAAEQPLEARAT